MQNAYVQLTVDRVGIASYLFKLAQEKNSALMRTKTVEEHRAIQRRLAEIRPIPANITVRPSSMDGVPCEWITREESSVFRVILYLHGGSWAFGDLCTARPVGVLLAENTDCSVVVADYRLAPEHPYPAGLEDCHKAYLYLLKNGIAPENIGIFGDSAGGNLALSLLHLLRHEGTPFPGAVACASPVTDCTPKGALYRQQPDLLYTLHEGKEQDIFTLYTGEEQDRAVPTISPFCGYLGDFPPLLLHVGQDEALCQDNIAFARKAREEGCDAVCKVWKEMFHDFSIVGITLKESRQSMGEITEHLMNNLG